MNPQIEALYEQIGQNLATSIKESFQTAWIYAEVQDGVSSVGLFYRTQNEAVKYQIRDPKLDDLVYQLWVSWKEATGDCWNRATYTLNADGKFAIDYDYDDIFNDGSTKMIRRKKWIQDHIGAVHVEYPAPPR